MPFDEKIFVVSYSGDEASPPPKVTLIQGQYMRTEPGCFRKEGGGKIHFLSGYWYMLDKLGQQVAWIEGGAKTVPETNWQTRGDGIFGSWEEVPVRVQHKLIDAPAASLVGKGPGCSEACDQCWIALKDKIPHEHRQTVEAYEAKAFEHKENAKAKVTEKYATAAPILNQHADTAKQAFNEYAPVAKEKGKEAYTACYDFITHPDTQEKMGTMLRATGDALKSCLAGCLAVTAGLVDQAIGNVDEQPVPTTRVAVVDNDQAMDASYVKLDSGTPVMVDPSHLPPRSLFLGDKPAVSPPPEDSNVASSSTVLCP